MPYDRAAGMTETQATDLAGRITAAGADDVRVEREGHFFVVVFALARERLIARDEEDWRLLQPRLNGS